MKLLFFSHVKLLTSCFDLTNPKIWSPTPDWPKKKYLRSKWKKYFKISLHFLALSGTSWKTSWFLLILRKKPVEKGVLNLHIPQFCGNKKYTLYLILYFVAKCPHFLKISENVVWAVFHFFQVCLWYEVLVKRWRALKLEENGCFSNNSQIFLFEPNIIFIYF